MLGNMLYTWNTPYTQGNGAGKEIGLHVQRKRKAPEGPAVEAELRRLGMEQQWLTMPPDIAGINQAKTRSPNIK